MNEFGLLYDLIRRHNAYVAERIDLVASNSWVSDFSRHALSSRLSNSDCIGFPGNRFYGGCDYIDMIEREVHSLVKELFQVNDSIVQFLSGMQANTAAYHAALRPGSTVISALTKHGGHYSHNRSGPLRFYSQNVLPIPFDESCYNIDLEGLEAQLKQSRASLLVVGWSEFLFPHPLEALRALCDTYGVTLLYDMSHVAGLIAGGEFQPNAGALCDILTSSTGKSLHAPGHGILGFNNPSLKAGIEDAVMPLLTSNTHPQELAALAITLAEMKTFGKAYAKQVIANSQALGRALEDRGLTVLYRSLGYSKSHTILVQHPRPGLAVTLLDKAGISINACALPWDKDGQDTGLRIGTQVVTRRGMKEAEMELIADACARVLVQGEDLAKVHYDIVGELASEFRLAHYSFDTAFPLRSDWQDIPIKNVTVNDIGELLLTIPALAQVSAETIQKFADRFDIVPLARSQLLFSEGAVADFVYFVGKGKLQILETRQGTEHVVGEIGEGAHVGELGVMARELRRFSVKASEASVLLRISADGFDDLLDENPEIHGYFVEYVRALLPGEKGEGASLEQ